MLIALNHYAYIVTERVVKVATIITALEDNDTTWRFDLMIC